MNVKLVRVETRTRIVNLWRVDIDGKPVGLVEKIRDDASTRNPWKAYLGIGNTTFLGVVYPTIYSGNRAQALAKHIAVNAVVSAHKGVDVSWCIFEKAHGIDAVIPAWKAGAQ